MKKSFLQNGIFVQGAVNDSLTILEVLNKMRSTHAPRQSFQSFDLDEALDGAKVVTRDGLSVSQLKRFDADDEVLVGVVHVSEDRSILARWDTNGESYTGNALDLYLYKDPQLFWVNIYNKGNKFIAGKMHSSAEEAAEAARQSSMYVGTICVDIDDLETLA